MAIKSKKILEQIRPEDKNLLSEKKLVRKFGRPEDCVELHIYDLNGNLLDTVYNFEEYEIPDVDDNEGFFNEITFNPDKALRDLGYSTGEYELRVNFHRKKIANTLENLFYINTISPSRTELRVKIIDDENLSPLISATNQFIAELGDTEEGIAYFKDFALNLGDDTVLTGVNFIAEQDQNNSFLIKLYEPLPNTFSEKSQFRIIEELTNPISYNISLGTSEITISSTELKGPNLRIDTRLNSSIPTNYKAFNDILSYEQTSSLQNVLNALSASVPVSVEYDNPNTDTGYTFEKFIHFGSAKERLENFKYKLELIELYASKSIYLDSLNQSSQAVKIEKENNQSLIKKVVSNFDNYERFLYFDKNDYAWPKSNNEVPYIIAPSTSSEALSWFGSANDGSDYYGGQLLSASNFDDENPYILRNALPQYIIDNNENEQFITFTDMIGQYFDNIWLYIENITDKNIAHNSLTEGISKDLVFNALKERGIPAFDQFENTNLFDYLIGFDGTGEDNLDDLLTGVEAILTEAGQVIITETGNVLVLSTPTATVSTKSDITKEVWKRLYHNAPYLLKTKGTERGIKALLACYGIPESILHVKEYGGPSSDKSGFRTFNYPKLSRGLNISGSSLTQVSFGFPANVDTIVLTVYPYKTDEFNVIFGDSTSNSAEFIAIQTSSIYEQSGRLVFNDGTSITQESSFFPVYSGNPITFFLRESGGSGLDITAGMYVDNEFFETSFNTNPAFKSAPSSSRTTISNYNWSIGRSTTTLADKKSNFILHNVKGFTTTLNAQTKEFHTKDPNIFAGNTTSSYFDNELYYYNPLGANIATESISSTPYNFSDYSNNGSNTLLTAQIQGTKYKEVTYNHHISTPDTVGSSMVSEKVRYDSGSVPGYKILSPQVRAETSTLDRQPQDLSNLGIFFSPTFEINEDIIYTLGGFRLDDYIGDPRHLTSNDYPDLKSARDLYTQKVKSKYNFFDYLKTIQYFDHTIFKIIEEFAPAKANLKTGLVIEPHYLERNKFNYTDTDFSNVSFPDFQIPETFPTMSSEYILHEATIDVEEVLSGSQGSFENNLVYGALSKKYFRKAFN